MPSNKATELATVRREGDALVFSGALLRDAAAGLWRQASAQLDGVLTFELGAVTEVDSAGVALLAELAARAGDGATINGDLPGLSGLRRAYRLDAQLGFAG